MKNIKRSTQKWSKAHRPAHRLRHIRLGLWLRKHRIFFRSVSLSVAFAFAFGMIFEAYNGFLAEVNYNLSPKVNKIIGESNDILAQSLETDYHSRSYEYNRGYSPSDEVAGSSIRPKFNASFKMNPVDGVVVNDPFSDTAITLKPKFALEVPRQDANRLIYPLRGKNASTVFTLQTSGFKEDIILNSYMGDEQNFKYELELPNGTEARLEQDGSLYIYGVTDALLGNVTASADEDAQLLEKARQNSEKNNLLFKIPAPFIKEHNKKISETKTWYSLEGDELTIHASGLKDASYPLSIDPSVYIETAAKLMRGNNETNTDFDVNNELIQKSQTTGARIDAWQGNLDMSAGAWDHATASAGGYVYRSGGRTGPTKPQIVDQEKTLSGGSNTSTFTMDMPTTRPAGDLYVAVMCHDGTGSPTAPSGGGWTEYADEDEHAAYYKIGTDEGGGNEAATYAWTGSSEEWAGVIMRVIGFDAADIESGTPGTTNSSGTPTFPATTPDANATLVIRAVGVDNDAPSDTGWVPTGHTKIDSDTSSSTSGDCGFAAASLDVSPAASVSTGTASLGEMSDTYGGSSIAINPVSVTEATQTTVDWAQFNSSTLQIESPNPGVGACSGWCNESVYDLPSARRGHSMVAYNGYLYVMGGLDGSDTRTSTVYVAKLGANGEPSLWHPTDNDPDNWVFWYSDTGLNGGTAKSYMSAVAYNNRMYVVGGQTNASTGGVTTVEQADILPNGKLGTWTTTGMQALPSGAGTHMGEVLMYNDTMYTVGGFEGVQTSSSNLRSAVYFSKVNSDGTMNTWQATDSFTTARSSFGGSMATIWGAYIYMGGGCSAVNGSGYCTTIEGDMQIASINADGSLDNWGSLGGLDNTRIGYSLFAWQGGLYRAGGCTSQDPTGGECTGTVADVDYGVINPAGEVSTVSITETSGSGNCTGGSPYDCDMPPAGDDAGEGGQLLSMSAILNGYLYIIGGCVDYTCDGTNPQPTDISGNISYVEIGSDGTMQAPSTCSGTSYGAWCVDSSNRINGTDGVAAGGITTFNNTIYVVGGMVGPGANDESTDIFYNTTNTDGSLSGAWSSDDMTSIGMTIDVAYTYAYARANPASAGSSPGNLFIFGGCANITSGISCGTAAANYRTEVYKCDIGTTGAVSSCTTTGQTQIDSDPDTGGSQGLGIHSGTVYANYIYLVGGYSNTEADKDEIMIAKFDDNNNVVEQDGIGTGSWSESPNNLSIGRRRGWAFGYNGHIYSTGGYDGGGGGTIPFIEWSKIDVSTGDIDPFVTSSVTINQRWGLTMTVSNSFAYVIGGCDIGTSPTGCSSFEPSIQTFQLYNNDSGSVDNFTAQTDQTFTTDTDRWGASSTIYDGYLYVAGGCTSATDCTDATNSVQYAPISASDGSIGTWAAGGNLPADRAWGSLEVAGGALYYIGGQDDTATNEQSTVYYTSSITSGNPTWNGSAATNGLPAARTKFGSAVWNDRLYVVGGLDGSAAVSSTVYASPQQDTGGDIATAWTTSTAFNVARTGQAVTAYANNLYLIGGYDGTNYLSDTQYTQINTDGTVDSWTYGTNLPGPLRDSKAVSSNGYLYLVGGRSAASTCNPKTVVTPISANTTIASGNNPSGVGEWYETNVSYTGDRYGAAVAYDDGQFYTMGGGCTAPLSSNRHHESTVNSQPQVAIYSRLIDTDTDVFPTKWLLNGLDNSIGARWNLRYRSMNDTDGIATDCGTADMTTWGQDTDFGEVTLGQPEDYIPKDGSGTDINCARYFYFYINIDASKTFGYPEDVTRGPTIHDLSLFFTSDPSKRLRHGKTFTGGVQQPLDTPF